MKNLLYKLNCQNSIENNGSTFNNWNTQIISCLTDIQLSKTFNIDEKKILLISLETEEELHSLFQTNILETINLPTVFLLKEAKENIITELMSRHFTHLFLKDQSELLVLNQINYMFEHYEYFITHKSSTLLKTFKSDNLTRKESQILKLIAESPRKQLHRDDIYLNIWGSKDTHTNTLDVHLCNLRRKLKEEKFQISTLTDGKIAIVETLNFQKEISL